MSRQSSKRIYSNVCPNQLYIKLLYNARKHDTERKFVNEVSDFKNLVSDPRFTEFYRINDNAVIIRLASQKIQLKHPMHLGWYVLEVSKLNMYGIFYSTFKDQIFKDNVKLQYMDTDSFLLNLDGVDVYKDIKEGKLKDCMDLSNFPFKHEFCDNTRKVQPGLLSSVWHQNVIVSCSIMGR